MTILIVTILTMLTPLRIEPLTPGLSSRRGIVLSTTVALQETGLLGVLTAMFQARGGHRVTIVALDSGQALTLAARGDADVVLVPARGLEQPYIARGKLHGRRLVMYDEVVIVGPSDDPAAIRGMNRVADAMRAIALRRAPFVSRGDGSDTHAVEKDLWRLASTEPAGDWYIDAGQAMGGTLGLAAVWNAYTLADRGTHVVWRRRSSLSILVDGERRLRKIYCVLESNAGNHPHVDPIVGESFGDFLVSDEAQDVIGTFGRATYGEPLFVGAAGLSDSDVTGSE